MKAPTYRYELINSSLLKFGKRAKYLEIGVCNPRVCFNRIETDNKDGVDPGVEFPDNPVKYKLTSDEFFRKLEGGELDKDPDYQWDVIFIDGLHLSYQVERDIHNALRHLNPKGFILLHDCNPPTSFMAREDYMIDGKYEPLKEYRYLKNKIWNGTVWKAFFKFRATNPYFDTCVVDTDWGVGVIRFGSNKSNVSISDNPFYEYNIMALNRKKHLGLIHPNEWYEWLNNKK